MRKLKASTLDTLEVILCEVYDAQTQAQPGTPPTGNRGKGGKDRSGTPLNSGISTFHSVAPCCSCSATLKDPAAKAQGCGNSCCFSVPTSAPCYTGITRLPRPFLEKWTNTVEMRRASSRLGVHFYRWHLQQASSIPSARKSLLLQARSLVAARSVFFPSPLSSSGPLLPCSRRKTEC